MNEDAIVERASIEHYEPPVHGIDEPMWIAKDPETECHGVGRVRAEAVGNLVALIDERDGQSGRYVRLPGRTVERTWDTESTLFDRLTGLL